MQKVFCLFVLFRYFSKRYLVFWTNFELGSTVKCNDLKHHKNLLKILVQKAMLVLSRLFVWIIWWPFEPKFLCVFLWMPQNHWISDYSYPIIPMTPQIQKTPIRILIILKNIYHHYNTPSRTSANGMTHKAQ